MMQWSWIEITVKLMKSQLTNFPNHEMIKSKKVIKAMKAIKLTAMFAINLIDWLAPFAAASNAFLSVLCQIKLKNNIYLIELSWVKLSWVEYKFNLMLPFFKDNILCFCFANFSFGV